VIPCRHANKQIFLKEVFEKTWLEIVLIDEPVNVVLKILSKIAAEALMKRTILSAFFLFGFALLSSVAHATSHEFFKGKTVRLVVGTSAGGAQDEWARFLAPHLARNIPGGPDIVVQNMPGAGTVIAANHIYNIANPDR